LRIWWENDRYYCGNFADNCAASPACPHVAATAVLFFFFFFVVNTVRLRRLSTDFQSRAIALTYRVGPVGDSMTLWVVKFTYTLGEIQTYNELDAQFSYARSSEFL
jgi:hypothetical protein